MTIESPGAAGRIRRSGTRRVLAAGLAVVSLAALLVVTEPPVTAPILGRPAQAAADPAPGISTFAGSGVAGQADGTEFSASFDSMIDMTVDPDGENLYVLEAGTSGRPNAIRKIEIATKSVTTFASGGMLASAPTHIQVDSQGQVWAAVRLSGTQKGIIRYPSGGGTPTTVVSNLCCDYYGSANDSGDAFVLDPSENYVYYSTRVGGGWGTFEQGIRRLDVSSLPADAETGDNFGKAGHFTRGPMLDMAFAPDGKLYVIWDDAGPGGVSAYPPQLYRVDGPGSYTLIRGEYFTNQPRLAFGPIGESAYTLCSQNTPGYGLDNGCRGYNLLVRRSGFGAGEASTIAGSVSGWEDGPLPGKLGSTVGLAMSLDGSRMWLADRGNHQIREVVLPPDPSIVSDADVRGGCNPAQTCLDVAKECDPVIMASGRLTESVTDVSIPGRGVPLSVQRTYNSDMVGESGLFGDGWRSNLDVSLAELSSEVVITQENGSIAPFSKIPATGGLEAPDRVQATLVKEVDGTWTFVRDKTQTLRFDSSGRLTALTDRNGYTTSLDYPSSSEILMTEPGGRTLTFTLNDGLVASVVDSVIPSRAVTYSYQGTYLDQVESFKMNAADSTPVTWGYDYDPGTGRLESVTDPRGNSNFTHYDAEGRVDYQIDYAGARSDIVYGGSGNDRWTEVEFPANNTSGIRPKIKYEFEGYVMTARTTGAGPGERRWRYEHDPVLLAITKVIAPDDTVVSETSYDDAGNPETVTDALDRTTVVTWDEFNNPLTVTDPEGTVTTNTYDIFGNLTETSRPLKDSSGAVIDTAVTTFERSDAAHPDDVTAVVDPDQHGSPTPAKALFSYDADYGWVTSASDPAGNVTTYDIDDLGRVQSVTEPNGNAPGATASDYTTVLTTNDFGLITSRTNPLLETASVVRDSNGNVVTATDPDGDVTTTSFDEMDRPTISQTDGITTETIRYPDGSIERQRNGKGHDTLYAYNVHGEVTSTTDPNQHTTTYNYNNRGELETRQDPSGSCPTVGCVIYTYDDAGQLTAIDYADADTPDTGFTYDLLGRRETATVIGSDVYQWNWDSLGRLRSTTDPDQTWVGYDYDLRGNLTSLRYPNGQTVTRGFDLASRLASITDWLGNTTTFAYDATGNHTQTNFPAATGNVDTFTYDQANRMESVTWSQGTTELGSETYDRDPEGMVDEALTAGIPAGPSSFDYDGRDQLTNVDAAVLEYDNAGNLTTREDGTLQVFDPAQQLCWTSPSVTSGNCAEPPADATTYTYDERGNRLTETPPAGPATTYGWDQANRLTSVEVPSPDALEGHYTSGTGGGSRILDTRAGSQIGLCPTSTPACITIPSDGTLTVQVTGQGGVPITGIDSVALTVTALNPAGPGALSVYPAGAAPVDTANVAYSNAGQAVSNTVMAKVSPDGQINIAAAQSATDVTIDVAGWYTEDTAPGGTYSPLEPARLIDTTNIGTQHACVGTCGQLATGESLVVQASGNSGIPATDVAAIALNVTVNDPMGPGALAVWDSDDATNPPSTYSIEHSDAPATTQLIVAKTTGNGRISIKNVGANTTDLTVDVIGWYSTNYRPDGNTFHRIDDVSLIDSTPNPRACSILQPNTELVRSVTDLGGVPEDATAVVLNTTAINGASTDTLTAWATSTSQPELPSMTYRAGQARTNTLIVPLSEEGDISFLSTGNVGLAVTVTGYYTNAADTDTYAYTYDADQLRRSKAGPDSATTFRWSLASATPVLLEESADGGSTNVIYGPGELVLGEIRVDGSVIYHHHDQLGSSRIFSDHAGVNIGSATFNAFGSIFESDGVVTAFGFAGQYTDTETGNQYLRARYYQPSSANFLSRDPAAPLTLAPYSYSWNAPTAFVDPSGLSAEGDYHYEASYSLEPVPFTPAEINREVTTYFSEYFPFKGCGNELKEGADCQLRFGPSRNDIRVEDVTDTSFTFRSMPGHDEGPDKLITFSFGYSNDGELQLTVCADGPTTWWQSIPGIGNGNAAFAKHQWQSFANNIRATLTYRAMDGLGSYQGPLI
jgi:RHS repeat-associated protein